MTSHLLCIGGEDHHLRIPFLNRLRDLGFRVTAAGSADPSLFAQSQIEYHQVPFARFITPLSDWKAVGAFAGLIRRLRPDLVQCFDTKPCILVPFAARAMPEVAVVCTANGLGWAYSNASPLAVGLRPVLETAQRAAAAFTALTVFQNSDDQIFYRRKRMIGPGGDRLIPGSGVDIASFDQAAAAAPTSERVRRELGLVDKQIVITVARMTREKGIPTLLKAAALVHRKRPNARFLLVGPIETEGRSAVRESEFRRHAPYVTVLGPRRDVPALLAAANLFVLPTQLREGVPRTLLEAAAASLPIVTTRVPGCSDVIKDGWSGYLVPPRHAVLLADRIVAQLDNIAEARIMGARAAEFVRREFNLELTVQRYVSAYEMLLERGRQTSSRGLRMSAAGPVDTFKARTSSVGTHGEIGGN